MSEVKSGFDNLGDRVKSLEIVSARAVLNEDDPICVRIDGKAFHTYTKGLARPYDERLSQAMINTMNFLIEKTDARLGYTQSDEISLVFFKMAAHQQGFFAGRVQKLTSVLSSITTAKFNSEIARLIPEKENQLAFFDCRVWSVPTLTDAAEVFVWRQEDAIKNAVSMAASAYYSSKQLHMKNSKQKIEMLKDKGFNWEEYPEFFKSGTFAMRKNYMLTLEDNSTCMRTKIDNFHLSRLKFQENFESVLFDPVFEQYKESIQEKKRKKQKP